jgi:hypothetical protein
MNTVAKPKGTKNYLVTLKVLTGGFEKYTYILAKGVRNEKRAEKYAIWAEAHDRDDRERPNEQGYYEDAGGEFLYQVSDIKELPPEDFEVLKRYII